MAMQRLTPTDFGLLENSGVKSVQIVWGKNAPEAKVTITRVTVQPGSGQIRLSFLKTGSGCRTARTDRDGELPSETLAIKEYGILSSRWG